MITQEEFEERVKKFENLREIRDEIGDRALKLIEEGKYFEGYMLIIATWNVAWFSKNFKKINTKEFLKAIEETNPVFDELKNEIFETANFDKLYGKIAFIYNKFNSIIKQTGTSKVMYHRNPNLFIMWDTKIRNKWKVVGKPNCDDYVCFLKLMQKEFSHIKWENKSVSFARAIDMYNFYLTQVG